ncbi:MAG: hypothetical protein IKJ09_02175 [Bacteroidaceae bacterium]|nr:hypothetical protein [Bacteroidaceae bacterium]
MYFRHGKVLLVANIQKREEQTNYISFFLHASSLLKKVSKKTGFYLANQKKRLTFAPANPKGWRDSSAG